MTREKYSLLYPNGFDGFVDVDPVTMHDLGIDMIVKEITKSETEQKLIMRVLSKMTSDKEIARYRIDVFEDILNNPKMREDMMKVLDHINFLRDYGHLNREYDETVGIWELMHRLDEIKDYVTSIDAIHDCLEGVELHSEGLKGLYDYINRMYSDLGFAQIKKDIEELNATTDTVKSVTVGINLNSRFEAESIGLISVNDKEFTKASALSNFFDHVTTKDQISSEEWDGKYKYHPVSTRDGVNGADTLVETAMYMANPLLAGLVGMADGDATRDVTSYLDRVVNQMLSRMVKQLRDVLNKYISITITDITDLIPEFIYYIRMAEFIEKLTANNQMCRPEVSDEEYKMDAKAIYNLKLSTFATKEHEVIITNDLVFDKEHLLYILTGANRGGKTTITQAIGQLFVLAQGGIYVPGEAFVFAPVDNILTHFPADEDKTMDLGRLGEECKRFKELYSTSTTNSLLLLNETFSTTSFEEGYFIAKDAMKAVMGKGVRTIYNTHMHKLAYDIDQINEVAAGAHSLIVKAQDGERSYKIEIAPPEGLSYAGDIAKKYGVTYEQLVMQ